MEHATPNESNEDRPADSRDSDDANSAVPAANKPKSRWNRPLVLLIVAAVIGLAWFLMKDKLSFTYLAEQEQQLTEFTRDHPFVVCTTAFVLYVVVTGLSLPFAGVLTLAMGWFFAAVFGQWAGFFIAVCLVSFASTTGSTLAFLLSRYLFRDWVQAKFGRRLEAFNQALEREGAFYLFTLRLVPAVPFWVINLVMGLTPIRVRTFWWVSQLGMLAGTCAFVWAGTTFPSIADLKGKGLLELVNPWLIVAFVVLGVLPLAARKTIAWIRPSAVSTS